MLGLRIRCLEAQRPLHQASTELTTGWFAHALESRTWKTGLQR
jgi:hypothetical protein